MADVVDNDTLEAVRQHWLQDPSGLPALFTEPPKTGRLKSPQTLPYAQVSCELARRVSAGTAGAWHDTRKVTVRIWGLKADVVKALALVGEQFNRDTILAYPSGARFIRWWPVGGNALKQDEGTYQGQDIWLGEDSSEVWSVRTS